MTKQDPQFTGNSCPEPDFSVLQEDAWNPPPFPLSTLGAAWGEWISRAAEAAACAPDYVAAPLLAAASVLIGNARWAEACPGWVEPPHLWLAAVGHSGHGKSPGADCLIRDVLPELERRMLADFPDRERAWRVDLELARAAWERWRRQLREAEKRGLDPPPEPNPLPALTPQYPRLTQHDVTVEKVAELLATAAPKGLFIIRDELAGWIADMRAYRAGGREFWIEAYGGRPFRVERKTSPEPIIVPHLAVAVYGGAQPEKLARLLRDDDDGLLGRMLWLWPAPRPFRLGRMAPGAAWAIRALDRLRELELASARPPKPVRVLLTAKGQGSMQAFAREMQNRQTQASGLLAAARGKARGQALRLSLVLEFLWWAGKEGREPPPRVISSRAFSLASDLIHGYFIPVAERVYGKGGTTPLDRNARTLAEWILSSRPREVHVRHLQRAVRLPGLRTAEQIQAAV